MYFFNNDKIDAGILTFKSTHPKWSFAKVDKDGLVTEVAEKNPISDTATVGFYYWKKGSDFVKYAESYGAHGYRLMEAKQLPGILKECLNTKGVNLVEIPVDYSENERVLIEELNARTCIL